MDGTAEGRDSVVIIANMAPSVITCLRSLFSRGIHTVAASEFDRAPAFSSRFCEESVIVPSPHEDLVAYKDALLDLAAREDVRTMIPVRDEDTYVFSKYLDVFAAHVNLVVPPLDRLRTVHDRVELVSAAKSADVPVPETESLNEVEDWNRELIVKPRYSILVDGYVETFSPSECVPRQGETRYLQRGVEPDKQAIREEMQHEPIVQELVRGDATEYAFAALYDRGEPKLTYQKRQHRGKTYAGGASVYRESVSIPQLECEGRKLLDHLDWHGLAEVEFIKDEVTGEFKLLEINPRCWASLPCAQLSGADFPYAYWLTAMGESGKIEQGYETGVATHLFFGELQYLASVLSDDLPNADRPSITSALQDVISSCQEHPNFDYLRLDDPAPFVYGILNIVSLRR